jgi:tetratricopeptide (TPR) repeat protein
MSFWRDEVVQSALNHETRLHMEEQVAWIQAEPANPQPYYNLAQFFRMESRSDEALGLLLEAVRLDAAFPEAHASLAELYAIRADYPAAWRHARIAERLGIGCPVDLLTRYGIPEEPV